MVILCDDVPPKLSALIVIVSPGLYKSPVLLVKTLDTVPPLTIISKLAA